MTALAHRLDRTLVIRAHRDTVFGFFQETSKWAAWWGAGSTIDARPGGRMLIRHPNGIEVVGEVLEVLPPERIVFTYQYVKGRQTPSGSSRVTVRLDRHPQGTLLQLTHDFAEVEVRDEHIQGWRFQLSLFANLIARTVNGDAKTSVDRWFAAWGEPDTATRERELAALTTAAIQFHDQYSCIDGRPELEAHLLAVQRFMPGIRLERRGDVRHCQWHALADWVAVTREGQSRGQGTNLFVFDADGKIAAVTGFWS